MDIDELINLQWDIENNDDDAPGYSADVKRPLVEKDCNVNAQKVLNDGVKRRRVLPCPTNDDEDEELLALLQASQVQPSSPGKASTGDIEGASSATVPAGAAGASLDPIQHSDEQQERPSAHRPDAEPAPDSIESSPATVDVARGPFRSAADVDGPCISVTGVDGERVYCSMQASANGREHSLRSQYHGGQLTKDSMHILMELVEKAAFERALLAAEPSQPKAAQAGCSPRVDQHRDGESMWVDKYTPRSFLELLGDEEINREVVRWLKCWDRCVFGDRAGAALSRAAKGRLAQDSRPEEKILLICGAPGLGKTTLAHVVARHCGYRALEINASDDRTAATLVARINDAVQMQSVLGSGRPNCVIIDEIDGAAGGSEGRSAINALLKLISSGSKGGGASKDGTENEDPGGTAGESAGSTKAKGFCKPLMRPLIAICNDLYAPVLRPLRAIAKIVHFKKPSVDRICSRLRHICQAEGLSVNRQALITLCDKTEQDLRSCLNTLQFLGKRRQAICIADLAGLQCGQKDISKSAFAMWQQLFHDKGRARSVGASTGSKALDVERYDAVADFGDHDLVAAGLHENFRAARYLDTHMARTAAILDHLADGDRLTARMQRRSDYALLKFAPAHALAIRAIVAGPSRTAIDWPRAHGDAHRQGLIKQALLHSWLVDVHPAIYSALSPAVAVQEVLPALLTAVSQHVRPVAPHLFTAAERATMQRMTELLLEHGATLALTGSDAVPVEGAPDITLLSPPVHRLILFGGIKRDCRALPLTVRQMIVQQVQLQAIKRREETLGPAQAISTAMASNEGPTDLPEASASQAPAEGGQRPPFGEKSFLLTVAQRAKEAAAAGARKGGTKQKLNWLDMARQKSEQAKQRRKPEVTPSQSTGADVAVSVRYKFHEGYTNAVKRPLKVRDLL
ncbi:hypothetical protein CVIRNUC_000533 [Coccomyxa viridis]|uniref:AAA+ ATPase domain-containing protein n=1 Tax=Coccomyxa viridis TaxID=1274662 RepID=A0AAV1HRN0_9CHLO|nr:hypothetical protein CVIRNUC_000533 [Coccomyxa viridis]